MLFGSISISVSIVAPVVVKPEMVSKNASVMEGIELEAIKGIEPIIEKLIQLNETVRKPSFVESSDGLFIKRLNIALIIERPAAVKI